MTGILIPITATVQPSGGADLAPGAFAGQGQTLFLFRGMMLE
ncbi:hypothetical protein DmGdi_14110 [Gluconobacter sp. Gdi]|nr:hypothetical protein DmGdi_14110 [Gluconobacter sp. Gdi]